MYTHQLYQQSTTAFLHQLSQLLLKTILCGDRIELAANVSLPGGSASTLLRLCFSQIGLALLLLCQGCGLGAVLLVLRPALGGQLRRFGRKERLPEALDTKFSHKGEACGSEEHLLAHRGAIGDVGDGNEAV